MLEEKLSIMWMRVTSPYTPLGTGTTLSLGRTRAGAFQQTMGVGGSNSFDSK